MKLHDQHVHTKYSMDSNQDVEAYFKKAKELGLTYFVQTDHLDFNVSQINADWLIDYNSLFKDYARLKDIYNITPLVGIELGYRKEYTDLMLKWTNAYDFDVINLSIHDSGKMDYYFVEGFKEDGVINTMNTYYNQMLDAVTNFDNFNVLSHLDYGYKTTLLLPYEISFDYHEEIITKILKVLIKKGKALEINTKVQTAYPTKDHLIYLLNLYKSLGGTKLTLSSDAHSVDRYMDHFDEYKDLIKSLGFNYLCYYIKQKEYHYDI